VKSLNSLTLSQKLWLYASGCIALILYLGWTFYESEYVAYASQVESLDADIRRKKGELRQILAQKQRLKDLEAEIELANQEFARLQEMFPDEEAIPRRLIDLTAVTRKSLTLPTKFLPLRVEEKEFYRENHYAITISSSYHALGMLFGEVANFRYPTAINKLQIDKAPDLDKEVESARDHGETPKTVVANFQLTTFTSKQ
jgi:type IV pilus assembly protein PilO